MADNSNQQQRLDDLLDVFINYSKAFNDALNKNIFVINDVNNKFKDAIKNFPTEDIKKLDNILGEYNNNLSKATQAEVTNREKKAKDEQDFINKQKAAQEARDKAIGDLEDSLYKLDDEAAILTSLSKTANDTEKKIIEDKLKQNEEKKNATKDEIEALKQGTEDRLKISKDIADKIDKLRQEEEAENKKRRDAIANKISEFVTRATSAISNMIQTSVRQVTSDYEKNAGTLSATLNTNVDYVSKIQSDIAEGLRETSLNTAISNIAVMSEVSNLAKAGYTNIETLQSSAEALAIGREIAPNLNLDSGTVKNLTSVFGTDFIGKFSAIQTAVQETAGSTIGIQSLVDSMLTGLEPVFANAEAQGTALQGMADVGATLSAAVQSGDILESQVSEYQKMITELMDPSKAFKSSNTAVRVAASMYDFSSMDPYQAFQALQSARSQIYSGVGMSMSSEDIIARSLTAGAFGDTSTMAAAYNPTYLQGLTEVRASELGSTFEEQLGKLQQGDYTTQKERESNILVNSKMTQWLSDVSKSLPTSWETFSSALFKGLETLPDAIAGEFVKLIIYDKISDGILGGLSKFLTTDNKIEKISDFILKKLGFGFGGTAVSGTGSSTVGGTLGTTAISSLALKGLGVAGIVGGVSSLVNQWDWDRGDNWHSTLGQNLGFGGSYGQSAMSWGLTGAGIGTLIAPGIGTAIGAAAGALVGLGTAFWANKEAQEENTRAIEAQTTATKDLLGYGVTAANSLEANREIARGGGIVHLSSGDYKLDLASYAGNYASGLSEVPYDNYVANLHKGEAIITAPVAKVLRDFNPNFWNSIDSNSKLQEYNKLYYNEQDDNVVNAIKEQTDSIVGAVRGDVDYSPLTKSAPKQYTISNNFA